VLSSNWQTAWGHLKEGKRGKGGKEGKRAPSSLPRRSLCLSLSRPRSFFILSLSLSGSQHAPAPSRPSPPFAFLLINPLASHPPTATHLLRHTLTSLFPFSPLQPPLHAKHHPPAPPSATTPHVCLPLNAIATTHPLFPSLSSSRSSKHQLEPRPHGATIPVVLAHGFGNKDARQGVQTQRRQSMDRSRHRPLFVRIQHGKEQTIPMTLCSPLPNQLCYLLDCSCARSVLSNRIAI
jgi:hypothetical protein